MGRTLLSHFLNIAKRSIDGEVKKSQLFCPFNYFSVVQPNLIFEQSVEISACPQRTLGNNGHKWLQLLDHK